MAEGEAEITCLQEILQKENFKSVSLFTLSYQSLMAASWTKAKKIHCRHCLKKIRASTVVNLGCLDRHQPGDHLFVDPAAGEVSEGARFLETLGGFALVPGASVLEQVVVVRGEGGVKGGMGTSAVRDLELAPCQLGSTQAQRGAG